MHSSVFTIFSWTGVDLNFTNIQDKIFLAFPNNQLFETSPYRPGLACLKNCAFSESYFSCGLLNLLVARAVSHPLHPPSPALHWRVSNLSNFTFKITILNLQVPLHPPMPTLQWRVSNLSNFTFKITILNQERKIPSAKGHTLAKLIQGVERSSPTRLHCGIIS